jgi:predicted N-acyltransferase
MARKKQQLVVEVVASIAQVAAAEWDACANPVPARFDPFISYAFLKALEEAGCVGTNRGWISQHLVLREGDGPALACAPCYVKTHSRGEYVFDYGWAEAFERAGGQYYPKLQVAVPFTPVPGRRLLVRPDADREVCEQHLVAGLTELARRLDCSSFHVTFLTEGEYDRLGALGCLQRTGQQFHWRNEGYESFEDFLATFASRKRKAVNKERREAQDGVDIEWVTGDAIKEAHWDAFYKFYMDTGSRKWGTPYLNRKFFSLLGASMADQCLLVMVRREDRYIAGALNLVGGECLYGRYWGAIEHRPYLHFEVCYYQAIDYAIRHKLARVEAGAQGEHKLARGYLPVTTYSAHWVSDRRFARAIEDFLDRERRYVAEANDELTDASPYRRDLAARRDEQD